MIITAKNNLGIFSLHFNYVVLLFANVFLVYVDGRSGPLALGFPLLCSNRLL